MYDYCEIAEAYSYSEPIARKAHKCCECFAPILKGEKHFKAWGKWSYGAKTYRQHLECCEACMVIRDDFNGGDCIPFGTLQENWQEMKYQYDRTSEHQRKLWAKLRHLMAVILWRERTA